MTHACHVFVEPTCTILVRGNPSLALTVRLNSWLSRDSYCWLRLNTGSNRQSCIRTCIQKFLET
jgi:hypothetical protein